MAKRISQHRVKRRKGQIHAPVYTSKIGKVNNINVEPISIDPKKVVAVPQKHQVYGHAKNVGNMPKRNKKGAFLPTDRQMLVAYKRIIDQEAKETAMAVRVILGTE